MLIERGADPTISTTNKYTVLHYSARGGDKQIMKFLLDNVVETRKLVDVKDFFGNTLHDCCCRDYLSPVIRLENAKMLVQASATLTIKKKRGKTPYECARGRGRKELAKYLWSQLSSEQQAREKALPSDW